MPVGTLFRRLAERAHHGYAGEREHNQQSSQRNGGCGSPPHVRSMQSFEQMVAYAERIGDDRQRRVDRAAGREERTVDDIEVVDIMSPAIGVQNRLLRIGAEAAGSVLMPHSFQAESAS